MGYRNYNYMNKATNYTINKRKEKQEALKLQTEEISKQIEAQGFTDMETLADDDIDTYNDWWGDTNTSAIGQIKGGLYYYYYDYNLINFAMKTGPIDGEIIDRNEKLRKMSLVPPVEAIQSVNLMPYLRGNEVDSIYITFDKKRMPIPEGKDGFVVPPVMPRVKKLTLEKKQVGSFKRFTENPKIKKRDWKNESKLQLFPYSYGIIADGITSPMEFRYEFVENTSSVSVVYLYQRLTNQGTYCFVLKDYKGDEIGTLEANYSNTNTNLPIVSNAYTSFMSSNQAQNKMQILNGAISGLKGATVGAVAGFATGGAVGAVVGGVGGATSGAMQIGNALAQRTDAKTTPNTLKDTGSDILLKSFVNNGYLSHFRMSIKEENKKILGDYFALYGYKQSRVMVPNLNSRHYYNFIRTVNCSLKGEGIPKDHLNKLKAIYNNGTTIWHVDRGDIVIGDYQNDNYEDNEDYN